MNIYLNRLKKILKKIESNSVLIIFGNREKNRNNDVKYRFRQSSNFFYLLGINEPNTISIIEKTKSHENIIQYH